MCVHVEYNGEGETCSLKVACMTFFFTLIISNLKSFPLFFHTFVDFTDRTVETTKLNSFDVKVPKLSWPLG